MATCVTGNTGTIAFADTGYTGASQVIEGLEETREALDCTNLASTSTHYIPDPVIDRAPLRVQIEWDSGDTGPPIDTAPEVITITFPLAAGDAVAAKLVGTGFISRRQGPTMENGTVMVAEYDVMFSDRPVYSAATP